MRVNKSFIKFGFLIILVGFFFAFGTHRNSQRFLTGKEIIFLDDNNHFITHETVNKLLIQNNAEVTSIPKEILDLKEMESRLNNNPMISKAEVFVTVDGVLGAKIKQRKPIARIAASTSYYIDEDGLEMPRSEVYSARVPLITGNSEIDYEAIRPVLLKIRDDHFMNHHIVGINVEENGDLTFYQRVHDFKIAFGKPENVETKFRNFKAFYQKTVKDSTISAYSLVNLKFDNQVVGTKK